MPTPDPEARPLHRLHHLIREQYLRLVEVGSTPPTEEELLALFSELYRLTAPMVEPGWPPTEASPESPERMRAWYQRRESSTIGEAFDVYEGGRLVHTYFTPEAAQAAVTQRNQALRAAAKSSRYWSVDLTATADEGFVQYAVYDRDTRLATFPDQAGAEEYLATLKAEERQRQQEEDRLKKNPNITILKSRDATPEEFKFDPSLFLKSSAVSWEY